MCHERSRQVLLGALLAAAVAAVYWQVRAHGFVEYDDSAYVSDNPFVRRGLTWDGVRWAFGTGRMGNWNPLTWLSHMLDVQLFGLNPGAHHLVSAALHLANTLLLFAVLSRMTGAAWPSAVVAALFGLHPLHVESVAWIAERKDVLSTLCWLLTLWAYARYAEGRAWRWYGATLLCFALGLMAKPMLVTLPFVLLLLDYWPLGRLAWPAPRRGTSRPDPRRPAPRSAALDGGVGPLPPATLLWEKVPLLALTGVFSAVAFAMQRRSGAVAAVDVLPIGVRLANALVAYVRYLGMALWPADLAVLYPYDVNLPLWQPMAAALALVAISAVVLRHAGRHPYALVGWLWYLGTLVPVIGLVQIGSQALADRYTYVPLIGVFIIVAWGGRALVARWAVPAPAVGAATAAILGAYAVAAWAQVGVWRDGETLLSHAIQVTRANCIAHNNLGVALAAQGRIDAALEEYRAALRIKPDYGDAHSNVGLLLWRQGRREDAAAAYREAVRCAPDAAQAHTNLGVLLAELGRGDEALPHLEAAVRLDPESAGAHVNLGNTLRDRGRTAEAIEQYEQALRLSPDYADPYNNLGAIRAQQGRRAEAEELFRTALRCNPRSADAHNNLGLVLGDLGRTDEAIASFSEAIRLEPQHADLRTNLGNALRTAGRQQDAIDAYGEALRVEPDFAPAHYNLGVALIQAGRPGEAIGHFERALQIKPDYAEARNDLGVALTASGQLAEAIEQFQQALRLKPDLADAQENLATARQLAQGAAEHDDPPAR